MPRYRQGEIDRASRATSIPLVDAALHATVHWRHDADAHQVRVANHLHRARCQELLGLGSDDDATLIRRSRPPPRPPSAFGAACARRPRRSARHP